MTTPKPLSPAAQAVRDAFFDSSDDFTASIAAAIRAAADQVVPESEPPQQNIFSYRSVWQWAVDCHHHDATTRSKFLAIAAELDGNTTTTETTNV